MGLDNPWQIEPCNISERQNSARSDSIDQIYQFLERGQLLADPGSTQYAREWAYARTDSFARAL
jgi:hypothetical protein